MIKKYKKLFTRNLSLINVCYWYYGERFGLKKITGGKYFFESMFIFSPKKGVSVYYDVSDEKQDPKKIIKYFETRPKLLSAYLDDYEKKCEKIKEKLLDSKISFSDLYSSIKAVSHLIALVVLIGQEKEYKQRKLKKRCLELRSKYDKLSYDVSGQLDNFSKKFVKNKIFYKFIFPNEILKRIEIDQEELKGRNKFFIFYRNKIYTERNLILFLQRKRIIIVNENYSFDNKIIKGSVAASGFVNGNVRLVFNIANIKKLKKGEILVAPMTAPEYLPAMKKASAIVTDEGGITCHAAIVSRELKKPCIIGTKIATQVLHDGDLVEVDAERGIVKIIKKAE